MAFAVLAVFSFAFVSCGNDEDDEGNNETKTSTATLDDKTYKVGDSSFFPDPYEGGWWFNSSLQSNGENHAFVIYYDTNGWSDGMDYSNIHIHLFKGPGSVKTSFMESVKTIIKSGSITVIDGGYVTIDGNGYPCTGLRFNNLTFTTSSNAEHTYHLNGTIYYVRKDIGYFPD